MKCIRIGTRGSPLALIQTQEVMDKLLTFYPFLKGKLEVVPIKTTGDVIVDRSLIDLGGKSLFTKEIEQALLNRNIDMAVHSMKDVTVEIPKGLIIPVILEREDPRDALISRDNLRFDELPKGTLFGTSSLRRQAYVLQRFPHFQVTSLRGNVSTRIAKIEAGKIDAALFAVAGLKRQGLLEKITQILPLKECLPAVAQGALGVQCRKEDHDLLEILHPLNHPPSFQAISFERAFMKALHGSCRTPIAAHAILKGESLYFKGMICEPDGNNMRFVSHKGLPSEAEKVGREAVTLLKESHV